MERRIKMIADYKKTSRPRWAGAVVLLLALACVVLTNAYVAKADFTIGDPINLGPVINTSYGEIIGCISPDGLEMYLDRKSEAGDWDIYVSRRTAVDSDWDTPDNLGSLSLINTPTYNEAGASISADGLTLYFTGGYGSGDIWVTTRATEEDSWSIPTDIGREVNSSAFDGYPFISVNNLELYFVSYRSGGYGNGDIWMTKRATEYVPWEEPVNLGPTINTIYYETNPFLSPDGLLLFFNDHSEGPGLGGYGDADIWMARRASLSDPWQEPVNLGPKVNSSFADVAARLSPDNSTLYFTSKRYGGYGDYDIWQVPILANADFNDDGNIDTDDLLILIDNWGQNEPLCDIGPTPFGDGIVNIKDIEVFMSYWEKENMPETPEEEEEIN
jgi:hypothetical protein